MALALPVINVVRILEITNIRYVIDNRKTSIIVISICRT